MTNFRGGLLVPFAVVLSMLALLLGALCGNMIGRSNQETAQSGPLDIYSEPVHHRQPAAASSQQPSSPPAEPDLGDPKL